MSDHFASIALRTIVALSAAMLVVGVSSLARADEPPSEDPPPPPDAPPYFHVAPHFYLGCGPFVAHEGSTRRR